MEPRHPTENPYWHPEAKPHTFDSAEISELCMRAFSVISTSLDRYWNDDLEDLGEQNCWSYPRLVAEHQLTAERELASSLLNLAVRYRTLDDQLASDDDFQMFKEEQRESHGTFLTTHGKREVRDSLRELCNKIIHADDLRPVYDNGSVPRDEGVWVMDGCIELEGNYRGDEWSVTFIVYIFLEALLETADYVSKRA